MAKSAASYSGTRFNALKFAIHVDGPMPCVGTARCPHRYCEDAYIPPLDGSPCPHEVEYARRLEAEFRERWDLLTIMPDVDDFEELVTEHLNIYLQRGRAMARMNRGWDKWAGNGKLLAAAYREFELANLYLDRLQGREDRLNAKIEACLEIMRENAERLRPHIPMIEVFTRGRKNAAKEAKQPHEPIYDEFVDGSDEPESG